MENKDGLSDVSKRVCETISSRMNKLFKMTLTSIEKEAKKYNIDPRFFAKGKDKSEGFRYVRKVLLDEGNDIIKLLNLILGEVKVTGKDSIVKVDIKKEDKCQEQE